MIAAALAAACADRDVLAHLAGPIGEAARARAAELGARSPAARRTLRAAWAAAARAPVPPGLRNVHPTWIEAALADLPARTRDDLARGGTDPAGVWLVRWALAELPPLPAAEVRGPPRSIADAIRMRAEDLAAWLASVGADQLAFALGAAGNEAVIAAAEIVGTDLLTAARRIASAPRASALGPIRAAIARARVPLDPHALVRIGARAIAPHVDALARRQLAVRLPRPIGSLVRDELALHVGTPVDQAPTWRALGAA